MRKQFILFTTILSISLGLSLVFGFLLESGDAKVAQEAAIYFVPSVTTDELRERYDDHHDDVSSDKIRILVAPGHEPFDGGTSYKHLQERELNVQLADYLIKYLQEDPAFEVLVTRDNNAWSDELNEYFIEEATEIRSFTSDQKVITRDLVQKGEVHFEGHNSFNNAAPMLAFHLYGINKWASENDVDLLFNVHFNDTPARRVSAGWPSGFLAYVPHKNLSNNEPSYDIARAIADRFETFYTKSNLESRPHDGIVFDEKLIALGANNTLDPASILFEYSYIFERRLQNKEVRDFLIEHFAKLTYYGILDFFQTSVPVAAQDDYPDLYFAYKNSLSRESPTGVDVLKLQMLLSKQGFFPPTGDTLASCPFDGNFGRCTEYAVKAFQYDNDLEVDGVAGKQVYNVLFEA